MKQLTKKELNVYDIISQEINSYINKYIEIKKENKIIASKRINKEDIEIQFGENRIYIYDESLISALNCDYFTYTINRHIREYKEYTEKNSVLRLNINFAEYQILIKGFDLIVIKNELEQ